MIKCLSGVSNRYKVKVIGKESVEDCYEYIVINKIDWSIFESGEKFYDDDCNEYIVVEINHRYRELILVENY